MSILAVLRPGAELFNQRRFFEAHEAWEPVWLAEPPEQRLLVQGLIQTAAAFYKLEQGAPRGAAKLLEQALSKLRLWRERDPGLGLSSLLPALETWLAIARTLEAEHRTEFDRAKLPTLPIAPLAAGN